MKNHALFIFSIMVIILSLCQFGVAMGVYTSALTRDFDFGPPMLIILSVVEGVVGVVGLLYSRLTQKAR